MTESTMDPSMWRERAQRAEAEVARLRSSLGHAEVRETALRNAGNDWMARATAAEDRLRKVADALSTLVMCATCEGTGTVTQDIDQHGRRYISQPVEEREHVCDDCDGTGEATPPERKWCAYHHHYEDNAACTCPSTQFPVPPLHLDPALVSSVEGDQRGVERTRARMQGLIDSGEAVGPATPTTEGNPSCEAGAEVFNLDYADEYAHPAPVVAPSAEGR